MSLRHKLKTNTRLETEGVTLQLDNTRVLLARAGGSNQKYNALMAKWLKDNRRAVELDAYSNDKFRNELAEFYADTIVLNGKPKSSATASSRGLRVSRLRNRTRLFRLPGTTLSRISTRFPTSSTNARFSLRTLATIAPTCLRGSRESNCRP